MSKTSFKTFNVESTEVFSVRERECVGLEEAKLRIISRELDRVIEEERRANPENSRLLDIVSDLKTLILRGKTS